MHSSAAWASLAPVSAEDFFDHVARTLAEPMPRRRAVRVLGASLAALAVPGVSPRRALAGASASSQVACNKPGQPVCNFTKPDRSPGPDYCCPYPPQQWDCSSNSMVKKCINHCPATIDIGNRTVNQKATWSAETDATGRPIRFQCCVVPDTIPKDGECLPNCPYQYRFGGEQGPVACGKTCCATHQICVDGECQPCEKYGGNTCQPSKGRARCCNKGTTCCFNETTTACCGPKQTCRAQNRKKATCVCEEGTKKCGPDCCEKGESCCGGKKCCKKGETCTPQGCCPKGRAMCKTPKGEIKPICCGEGEYCFWKVEDGLVPLVGTCKKGCAPGNTAGTQCCGTGFKFNRSKTACVPE